MVFGGVLGQISIFGEGCAEWAFVLVGILGRFSGGSGSGLDLVGFCWYVTFLDGPGIQYQDHPEMSHTNKTQQDPVLGCVVAKRSLCPCAFVSGGQRRWLFGGW